MFISYNMNAENFYHFRRALSTVSPHYTFCQGEFLWPKLWWNERKNKRGGTLVILLIWNNSFSFESIKFIKLINKVDYLINPLLLSQKVKKIALEKLVNKRNETEGGEEKEDEGNEKFFLITSFFSFTSTLFRFFLLIYSI